jgi:2-hydroxy-3-oxopropionate reductase
MEKIGFIGLGIMGKPMSKNLLKAGYPLVVYDIVPAAVEEVVGAGAEKGTSPKDVAAKTGVIITMLPNSPHVKEVVLGKDGVIEAARPGSILIDMSSIAPLVSREVAARLAERKSGCWTPRSVAVNPRRSTERCRSWSAATSPISRSFSPS